MITLFNDEILVPTSTKQYRLREISSQQAARLNNYWHSTNPTIGAVNTFKICFGAEFEGRIHAIAIWSNPVARLLPQSAWLELRRYAMAPYALRNLPTRMMRLMKRVIRARFPAVNVLCTYQDESEHDGTIYKAMSDWESVEVGSGGPWSNRTRSNRTAVRKKRKVRWQHQLRS